MTMIEIMLASMSMVLMITVIMTMVRRRSRRK